MIAISIVIPCLNAGSTLPDALASLATQLDADVEVVVADGGSSDGSREIVSASGFARLLPGGDDNLYAGLMRGVAAANGEYVLFLNADDRLGDGAILAYRDVIARNPDMPMVTGLATIEGDREHLLRPRGKLIPAAALFAVPAINARLYRRSLFERFGFQPKYGLAADRQFLFQLAVAGISGAALDQVTYRYRSHVGSRTIGADRRSRVTAVTADLRLSEMLCKEERKSNSAHSELVESWHALQALRSLRWRISGERARPFPVPLSSLPKCMLLWRVHRTSMAGW